MKLSTGQVSKLFNITKDTLRHYDKIGILKPEINKSNGYRYYSQEHLDQLSLILATKDLDISLSDIKEAIESEDLLEYKKLINKQEMLIKEKIESLIKKQKQLEVWNETLDTIINYENEYNFDNIKIYEETYDFYLVNMSKILEKGFYEHYIKCLDEVLDYIDDDCCYGIHRIIENKYIEEDEINLLMKKDESNKDIIDKYVNYMNNKLELLHKRISGNFLCVKFYGNYDELSTYIIKLNKNFSKHEDNDVLIKYDFCIPKKNDDEKYFVEILLKI